MKLHHIGIAVAELETAISQYKLLGLKETDRGIVEKYNVAISMLSSGDGDEPKLELLQPLGEGGVQKFMEKRGGGIHHIAYGVPNLVGVLDELKSQGMKLIDEVPRDGFGGHKIAFLHPDNFEGVLVELVEIE